MSLIAKYGALFPRQTSVPEIVPRIDLPKEPGNRETGIATRVVYEQGLVEGRRQILIWMKEAIDTLIPMAQPSAMGKVLIAGLRQQVDKYLLSGKNPLEDKTDEQD